MNTENFLKAYGKYRNGASHFCRNPLYRTFVYSDGVQACAEAGCYWLLDILGTELPAVFRRHQDEPMMIVTIRANNGKATIDGSFSDDGIDYVRRIDHTDLPDGDWVFYVGNDGDGLLRMILPTEY